MGWGSFRKKITRPLKKLGREIGWKDWGPEALATVGGGVIGLAAYEGVSSMREMSKAQKEADARAAKEADNPVLAPETALGTNMLNVDQEAEGDVTARRRRRTSVSQSTSRGLTRVLGGGSKLN